MKPLPDYDPTQDLDRGPDTPDYGASLDQTPMKTTHRDLFHPSYSHKLPAVIGLPLPGVTRITHSKRAYNKMIITLTLLLVFCAYCEYSNSK